MKKVLRKYVLKNINFDKKHYDMDDSILVIHIRSGDVFSKFKHLSNHIQPPLAFYEYIIQQKQ